MRLVHISDLHIGKRVNEFSMLEEQRDILRQVLEAIQNEQADAVLIAGDIYDRSVPSAESVVLLDEFLTKLSALKKPVFIISGNHDCAERISFGAGFFQKEGIYIAPVFDGNMKKVTLTDEFGDLDIYMLPFIKPPTVRRFFEEELETYTDAVRCVIEHTDINPNVRNLLIAHQFVTGAVRCDSEEVTVGGLDNVDAAVFAPFDYVALGHIHSAQKVFRDTIRYCGTLLKYSFSEVGQKKSITIVDIGEKNADIHIRTIPVTPLHDLREIRGTYNEITLRQNYIHTAVNDYMHITLTDEEDIPDAIGKLRSIYPNIMRLDYDNTRTRNSRQMTEPDAVENRTPQELFEEFYELQNNQAMNDSQREYVAELIEDIWGNT